MKEQNKTWKVYEHWTPDNEVYVGITSMNMKKRWKPSSYQETALQPYIERYGWDNIEHKVVFESDNEEEALKKEDELIQYYRELGICINKQRSGLIYKNDPTLYQREFREENKDTINEWYRNDYKENPEKYRSIQRRYRENHLEDERARVRETVKKWRSTPEGRIYTRVASYNQRHPDKITITPLEAKNNYLQFGIIPDFIKKDDLVT